VTSKSIGCGLSRATLQESETFGVETDEGIWIRVGDEFGRRTQTLVMAIISCTRDYIMVRNEGSAGLCKVNFIQQGT